MIKPSETKHHLFGYAACRMGMMMRRILANEPGNIASTRRF